MILTVPLCVTAKAIRIPSGDQTGLETLPFIGGVTFCIVPVDNVRIYRLVVPVSVGSATNANMLPSFDQARLFKIASPAWVSHTDVGVMPALSSGCCTT